jgi:hypothetical protein
MQWMVWPMASDSDMTAAIHYEILFHSFDDFFKKTTYRLFFCDLKLLVKRHLTVK